MPESPLARLLPWIRSQFPQVDHLRDGRWRIYLDNAAGTLVPQTVADAMAEAALWANPQPSRSWPAGPETLAEHRRTRGLLADFLNAAEGDRLFFSESATACLYKLREALEPRWGGEDNLVVTDCDHFANISAWEWRARWEIRRAGMRPDGHLDPDHLAQLVEPSTRVVAFTLAGNGLGTLTDARTAVRIIRDRAPDALVVIDAVHAAPHVPIDVQALGADALVLSTYKLFGPMGGVLWMNSRLAALLEAYRVAPHTDPETLLEWGSLDNVAVSGTRAALEYLERLGERLEPQYVGQLAEYPRRRRRFKIALAAVSAHEAELSRRILEGLERIGPLSLFGVAEPARVAERVPTFAFEVAGLSPEDLERRLWDMAGLQVAAGSHYSGAILRGLGRQSLARASFSHYSSTEEADTFIRALADVS